MYSYVVAHASHTLCNIFAMIPSTEILVLGIALAASQLRLLIGPLGPSPGRLGPSHNGPIPSQ